MNVAKTASHDCSEDVATSTGDLYVGYSRWTVRRNIVESLTTSFPLDRYAFTTDVGLKGDLSLAH